jgi:cytoskeleton-associated protein 5
MGDLSACLDGCKIFSKLDLQKGYHEVPVALADIHKTAVIMPFGLFEFVCMPFGLKNVGMTFQRLMDHIFFDLPFSFIYLDDLLVASRSTEEHRRHLWQALLRLQENGLVINREKCVFGRQEVDFLGHRVAVSSVSPLPERVAAIRQFPRPKNIQRPAGIPMPLQLLPALCASHHHHSRPAYRRPGRIAMRHSGGGMD